jgi:predicted transcriptional regulator
MFRKICRDAFGRDCFCAQGGHCWLTEAALDGLKFRDDVAQTEIVAGFEAADPGRLQQILEYSEQLREWQRAANRATKALAT